MVRIAVVSLVLSIAGTGPSAAAQRRSTKTHVVESGQTLWGISRAYGCSVAEIQGVNEIDATHIRPGQKLRIPRRCEGGGGGRGAGGQLILTHQVASGDTLIGIAKRYDTSVQDIRGRNGIEGNLIRPGQKLRVAVGRGGEGRAIPGQSVGSPSRGKLVNAMQLPPGRGYYRRRPHRAWGANHTIYHIRRAVSAVRSRFPHVHNLAIGDISSREGGKLAQHKSHQSGRDVDVGLYFKKRPDGYPRTFIRGNKRNLDLRATWALLEAFANTVRSPSGVEKMFLNYELQEVIYKWARKRGISKRRLRKIFQYPHGKYASHGIIRHEPGHDTHVHVRFKCPRNDKKCR